MLSAVRFGRGVYEIIGAPKNLTFTKSADMFADMKRKEGFEATAVVVPKTPSPFSGPDGGGVEWVPMVVTSEGRAFAYHRQLAALRQKIAEYQPPAVPKELMEKYYRLLDPFMSMLYSINRQKVDFSRMAPATPDPAPCQPPRGGCF